LRPIDDGLICHVINRGNNRQDVFYRPEDFRKELDLSFSPPTLSLFQVRKLFNIMGHVNWLIVAWLMLQILNLVHWRFQAGQQSSQYAASGHVDGAMLLAPFSAAVMLLFDLITAESFLVVLFGYLCIIELISLLIRHRSNRTRTMGTELRDDLSSNEVAQT